MAQFINIQGTIINLDHIEYVDYETEHHPGNVYQNGSLQLGTLRIHMPNDNRHTFYHTERTPYIANAYAWLKTTCVATFVDEPEHEAQS